MKIIHGLLVSATIGLATPALGVAATLAKDELTFEVSLNDQPIGVHRFRIADSRQTKKTAFGSSGKIAGHDRAGRPA